MEVTEQWRRRRRRRRQQQQQQQQHYRIRKLPWPWTWPIHFPYNGRRTWQPTPVFLPGKFHGWRSLVGYSPWGRKESERLHFLSHTVMRCMGCDPAMSYRLGGHEWFFCNRQVHQVTILYPLERRMLYVLHEEHSISIHRDMKHITSPSFSIFQWRVCIGCAKRKEKKRKESFIWGGGGGGAVT